MSNLSSVFRSMTSFLKDHQVSFVNGLLVVFTLGGEQIFRFAAFRCPCEQPTAFVYGCSFLFGPAFVLGIIGILVNNLTWRLCHGCWYRSSTQTHGIKESFFHCGSVLSRACIMPSAWIFVTLLEGNYYSCLASSAPCEAGSEENRRLVYTSQIISWIFLVAIVSLASIAMIINRCTDTLTFTQSNYLNIYRDSERLHFEELMKEVAQDLAKANIISFLRQPDLTKEDWDAISKAPKRKISLPTDSQESGPFYTPLHKWAEMDKKS